MQSVIQKIENSFKKKHVTDVKSGDTVRVHQKIREGNKERIQIFEGLVIRTDRPNSHTASICVRRIASGVGVEKTYMVHSPLITEIEVTKRGKVRRNYLSYMRERTGKSARLTNLAFDKKAVNAVPEDTEATAKPEEVKTEVDKVAEKETAAKSDQPAVKKDTSKEQNRSEEKAEKAEDKKKESEAKASDSK